MTRGRHREAPYEAVLGQMVTIREGGASRRVTAAGAFLLQLTNVRSKVTAPQLVHSPFSWFVPSRSAAALEAFKSPLPRPRPDAHSDFAVELETEMPYRRLYVRARECVLRITKDC
jgi:hypothetical protein